MAVTIKGKEYVVRSLNFDDVEIISRIIDHTGVNIGEFEQQAQSITREGANVQAEGTKLFLELIGQILKNYHKAHKDVLEFVGSLIGEKPESVSKMPISAPMKVLKELAKDEDARDFFSSLLG
jgi:iron-sulfur cluster repair protein YtfE (RIC family)